MISSTRSSESASRSSRKRASGTTLDWSTPNFSTIIAFTCSKVALLSMLPPGGWVGYTAPILTPFSSSSFARQPAFGLGYPPYAIIVRGLIMPDESVISNRKVEHLRINLEENVQFFDTSTGLERYRF